MVGKSPKYMEVVILWLRVVPRETLRIALRNTFGLQHGSSPSTAGFTTIHEIFSIPRGEHSGASNFWMPQELAFMFFSFSTHQGVPSQERPGLSTTDPTDPITNPHRLGKHSVKERLVFHATTNYSC